MTERRYLKWALTHMTALLFFATVRVKSRLFISTNHTHDIAFLVGETENTMPWQASLCAARTITLIHHFEQQFKEKKVRLQGTWSN